MKEMIEKLGTTENRVWGLATLLPLPLLIISILWWNKFSKEEKLRAVSILSFWVLIVIGLCVVLIGWAFDIVMAVFYIIAIVKFFKGDLDHKIPVVSAIANAFVKN